MASERKKTPLYGLHLEDGAKMGIFGGYEMPLWYPSGARKEHLAVLSSAGLFDTSHMSGVLLTGAGAFSLLQRLVTKDLTQCVGSKRTPLVPGKAVYGVFLKENGHVVDDTIIFDLGKNRYLAFVNAGMGNAVALHLEANRIREEVIIKDLTGKLGKIDIQGPKSAAILKRILKAPETVLKDMTYFSFKGNIDWSSPDAVELVSGDPVMISRTGYTGEFGFEVFVPPDRLEKIWNIVLDSGKDFGLTTCGLAARDSLRTGAVLPLSHQDIGEWPYINHPWPFALPYNDTKSSFTKAFLGDLALLNPETVAYTYPYVGYDLRKVQNDAHTVVRDHEGRDIGSVLTCVSDMGIGRHDGRVYSIAGSDRPGEAVPGGLCCGFVKIDRPLQYHETLILKDARRTLEVEIVPDIRPDRTARMPMKRMLDENDS